MGRWNPWVSQCLVRVSWSLRDFGPAGVWVACACKASAQWCIGCVAEPGGPRMGPMEHVHEALWAFTLHAVMLARMMSGGLTLQHPPSYSGVTSGTVRVFMEPCARSMWSRSCILRACASVPSLSVPAAAALNLHGFFLLFLC